jgi:hypothetical protein
VAYEQMGWFAPAAHTNHLEHEWIVWDRLLLDDLHLRAIIESLGPVVPSLLELSYALVYVVPPITMGVIYALGLRKRADTILTIYLLGLCHRSFSARPSRSAAANSAASSPFSRSSGVKRIDPGRPMTSASL